MCTVYAGAKNDMAVAAAATTAVMSFTKLDV